MPHHFIRKVRQAMAARKARGAVGKNKLDRQLHDHMIREFGDTHSALKRNALTHEHTIQAYGRVAKAKRNAALRRAFIAAKVFAYETRNQLLDGSGKLKPYAEVEKLIGKRRAQILTRIFTESMRIGGELEQHAYSQGVERAERRDKAA